jgi:hypothetical protein
MTNDHYWTAIKTCHTTNNRFIICVVAITSKFIELSKYVLNVIKRVRTLWVTSKLGSFPSTKIAECFLFKL